MILFTTEVRYICEHAAGYEESQGFGKVNDILKRTWRDVIPQEWEIFDEEYRGVLCQKILKHYYTREIAYETVGLWQLKIETKLNEIMPYYNELYRSRLMQYDPFRDVDYWRDHSGSGTVASEGNRTNASQLAETNHDERDNVISVADSGNSAGTRQRAATEWNVYSDTPQGALTHVQNNTYLTDARKIEDTESTAHNENYQKAQNSRQDDDRDGRRSVSSNANEDTTNNVNSTDEYLEHIYGKYNSRTYMSIIKEVREVIINIDMMIIDDLKDQFFMLWR